MTEATPEQVVEFMTRIMNSTPEQTTTMLLTEIARLKDVVARLHKERREQKTDEIEQLKAQLREGLDLRLNNYLCEMRPGYDDSITGFNEAWDIMRRYLEPKA